MSMKNYKEMADAVFARRDEYVVLQRRKKKIALNTCLSLCAVCLAVVGAVSIWKTGIVEPDPDVLGTKPGYVTEGTESTTKFAVGSNATSEGEHSEVSQIISHNTSINTEGESQQPQSDATQSSATAASKPLSSDPTEKVTKPAARPPIVMPTLPQAPVVTDPLETSPPADKPADIPQFNPMPPTIAPPYTEPPYTHAPVEPSEDIQWEQNGTTGGAVSVTDAWEDPDSPEQEVPVPETMAPTLATGDVDARPDEVPATEAPCVNIEISGKVYDQYGNPVKDCEIWAYSRGMVVASTRTDSNGAYTIYTAEAVEYLVQYSAPEGYTPSTLRMPVSGAADSAHYGVDFYCTKN